MFRHGQNLNNAAIEIPSYLYGTGPAWFTKMAVHNAESPIPAHTAVTLRPFLPYSRFGRFASAARPIVFSLLREYNVQVDAEAWFLVAIVHTFDHLK